MRRFSRCKWKRTLVIFCSVQGANRNRGGPLPSCNPRTLFRKATISASRNGVELGFGSCRQIRSTPKQTSSRLVWRGRRLLVTLLRSHNNGACLGGNLEHCCVSFVSLKANNCGGAANDCASMSSLTMLSRVLKYCGELGIIRFIWNEFK